MATNAQRRKGASSQSKVSDDTIEAKMPVETKPIDVETITERTLGWARTRGHLPKEDRVRARVLGPSVVNDLHGVLICSRGRPEQLIATVMQLHQTARQPRTVIYGIRVDEDDPETIEAAERLAKHVTVHIYTGPKPGCLGAEINTMALNMDCGIYHVLNDDVTILCRDWDTKARDTIAHPDNGPRDVYCWNLLDVGSPDYPIVTRQWLDAAGAIFPDSFRFWFDDMTLATVQRLVTGRHVRRIDSLELTTRKTTVQGMRDIAFWAELYRALLPERVRWAQIIADNFGMGIDVLKDRIAVIRDAVDVETEKLAEMPASEARYGDRAPPDEAYLDLKAKGEAWLAANKPPSENDPYLERLAIAAFGA